MTMARCLRGHLNSKQNQRFMLNCNGLIGGMMGVDMQPRS